MPPPTWSCTRRPSADRDHGLIQTVPETTRRIGATLADVVLLVFCAVLFVAVIVAGIISAINYSKPDPKTGVSPAQVNARQQAQVICPHCHNRGGVTWREVKRKQGISGAKATGAVLTGGLSVVATGLSRKGYVRACSCHNCGMKWDVA